MASLPSLWKAMVSSRLAVTSPSAMKYAVSVGVISMVARRMIPVSPLPPTVAQNRSGRLAVRGDGADLAVGGQQVHGAHVVAEAAGAVVVLAVDVAGDGAPTVTCRVPGSTGTHNPSGSPAFINWSRFTPASTSTVPVVGVDRVDAVQGGHVDDEAAAVLGVVAVGAAEAARDHAAVATPSAAWATALTITSGSGVDNTSATLGAVRPQPVSRCFVVVNDIVTRVPCPPARSPQPEDPGPLHDEVDHRGGALRDHEGDQHAPGLALELQIEEGS